MDYSNMSGVRAGLAARLMTDALQRRGKKRSKGESLTDCKRKLQLL